jgi:hypothetical protein
MSLDFAHANQQPQVVLNNNHFINREPMQISSFLTNNIIEEKFKHLEEELENSNY